jgi:hypothetical protein
MNRRLCSVLPVLVTLLALIPSFGTIASRAWASDPVVAVTTQHNDTMRTGVNSQETILTTGNVNVGGFGKLFSRALDGLIYAQPLVVPHLLIPGKGVHNVVFVATMHNSVYAYDADNPDTPAPLWHVRLDANSTTPVPVDGCYSGINPPEEIGIVSTPVIDLSSNTMFVVDDTKSRLIHSAPPKCIPAAYRHYLHALDIGTGRDKVGPVAIRATAPATGPLAVKGRMAFNSMQQLQRPALLLSRGAVYIGFGAYPDVQPYDGWLLGYDAATLRQKYAWISAPNPGYGGSLWMSGQGPLAAEDGDIYAVTANGQSDALSATKNGGDYSESVVRLRIPRSPTSYPALLSVVDWFMPHNYAYLNQYDLEMGVDGLVPVPNTNLLLTGSKVGTVFVLNRNNLGKWHAGRDSQIVESIAASQQEIFTSPVCWRGPTTTLCYIWPQWDVLKAFRFDPGSGLFPVRRNANGLSIPTYQGTDHIKGRGGFLSVSANGRAPGTGILWALSDTVVGTCPDASCDHGVLRAYDATNLKQIWNSEQDSARDRVGKPGKFVAPTVANGKVYVTTWSRLLDVYGLLPTVVNGSFEGGQQPWVLYSKTAQKATLTLDSTAAADGRVSARIMVPVAGKYDSDVGLYNANISLVGHKKYTLTFYARSARPHVVHVIFQSGTSVRVLVGDFKAASGRSWAKYSFRFTTPADTSNATLLFALADVPTTTWLDGVNITWAD